MTSKQKSWRSAVSIWLWLVACSICIAATTVEVSNFKKLETHLGPAAPEYNLPRIERPFVIIPGPVAWIEDIQDAINSLPKSGGFVFTPAVVCGNGSIYDPFWQMGQEPAIPYPYSSGEDIEIVGAPTEINPPTCPTGPSIYHRSK